ncbi:MAG: hypothetical protein ACFFD3_03025 [Candidatus Thorarchaeota archaeon]
MGISQKDSLQTELHRASRILKQTRETVDRIITILEPTERALLKRDFQSKTVLDPGESKVVLCLEEELAESKAFRKAISKLEVKKPTLVKIPGAIHSRQTNLTVAKMIPAEVLARFEGPVLVINLQKELMLKQLENTRSVIIGKRYFLESENVIEKLTNALQVHRINVNIDYGLNGGGSLTYELVKTLENRTNSSVLELTLSKSISENTDTLRRVIESLLSL